MNNKNYRNGRQNPLFVILAALLFSAQLFAQTAPAALSAIEKDLAAGIKVETIKDITIALSADEMMGRGTMQPGGDKAANWIADRMKTLGLKPLGDKGSYLQKIDFRETTLTPETSFKVGSENLKPEDFGILPYSAGNKSVSGNMVFIAYGMVVDKMKRNDLGNMNLEGKIVVMLEGPPAGIPKKDWDASKASQLFIRNLAMHRVAGFVFIGHGREQTPIERMVDYFNRRQISLSGETGGPPEMPLFAYVSKTGAEKLFAKSKISLKDALAQAERTNFNPVDLNQSAKISCKTSDKKGSSSNVAGFLEGSDPALKAEAVVFSAHYDAYGTENGKIYHGAADNALGVAEMLSVAEAFSKMPAKPKRSLIFLAVTGEEYGLYGSKYWSKHPTWDIKKVTADLNLDGIGTEIYAPVKTFVGFGAEHSTIGTTLTDVSSAFGIKVIPDPMPDEKIFYRSDHYSFVERGVPSLMLLGAPEGEPQKWIDRSKEWEKTDYHQPNDTIRPDWVWEGAETVAEVMGIMGWRISETEKMPEWLSTSRFAKLERGNTKDVSEEK